jgi:thymidylate synthase
MTHSVTAFNVPQAYFETLFYLKIAGKEESSRNGPVRALQAPFELSIFNPQQRVLFDTVRDANPFFHVMEFVWMMSGSKDLSWIKRFNSGFAKYSDDDKTLPASYGYRWRSHFGHDQINAIINHLRADGTSRRAVLAMWDPASDQSDDPLAGNDRPCNTHTYFRIVDGRLDMTVCNRSNDAVWGMLGANAVHMTMLQELVARALGVKTGVYRVYTNNLHIYTDMPKYAEISLTYAADDKYRGKHGVDPYPLLQFGETYQDFVKDCENLVIEGSPYFTTLWMRGVGQHMFTAYLNKETRHRSIELIEASDWKLACYQWAMRRESAK